MQILGPCDADCAFLIDYKTTAEFRIVVSGNFISCLGKKQPLTALSSTEVEHIIATKPVRELKWILSLMHFLQVDTENSTLLCDGQLEIMIVHASRYSCTCKHFDAI